jgi:hypothetical protein
VRLVLSLDYSGTPQIVPQIVPKPPQNMQLFEEVSGLFEVLFKVLFLPALIACDLTLPTHD